MSIRLGIITNNKEELDPLMNRYNVALIERQYKKSMATTREKLIKTFKRDLAPYLKGNQDDDEFFQLLNDVQKKVYDKSAEKMANEIGMGLTAAEISQTTSEKNVKEFIKKLDKCITTMKSVFEPFGKGTFQEEVESTFKIDNILSNINNNGVAQAVSDAKAISREYFLGSNYSFSINDTFKRSFNTQKKNIQSAMANLEVLKRLAREVQNQGVSQVSEEVGKFAEAFLMSTFSYIGKIVGIFSEDFLQEDIERHLDKTLEKSFQNNKDIQLSVKSTGTEKGTVFHTKTTDIQISLNIPKMLDEKEDGKIQINLPGASLKRTRNQQGGSGKISLKTGASFKNFIDNMDISNKNQHLSSFYNAFVNYRRSFNKHFVFSDKNKMENMYSFFKVAMFPLAAAGSLDKEDFAYFLVINNQTYNVIDIMQKMGTGQSLAADTSVNFQEHQSKLRTLYNNTYIGSNAEDYHKIIQEIQQMDINYKLSRKLI